MDAEGAAPRTSLSADTYRALVEFAPDAIVVIDSVGTIQLVNAHAEAMFGYARGDLLGRVIETLLPARFRERHSLHRGAYLSDPRSRPMGVDLELFGLRKDGSEFPVDVSLAPLQTGDGFFMAAAIRDISDRKKLEQFRDEFIRNAAHELRTPMSTLAGLGETLADHFDHLSREQIDQILSALRRQGERAASLIATLLDLSRLESGAAESTEGKPVSVAEAVRQAVAVAPPPPHVTLASAADEDLWIVADPVRVDQVLNNLLTNAYRYGGSHVRIEATGEDSWVTVCVTDDGRGVEPTLVEHLFQPFTRGAESSLHGGSGVGLALTKRIVEAQGGKIRYVPGGSGARFEVTFRRGRAARD